MALTHSNWARRSLSCFLLLLSLGGTIASPERLEARGLFDPVCERIQSETSAATKVYWPGSFGYTNGIKHWASSSTQLSDCVVEPVNALDVGIALQIVGETRTEFAVKGGGHTSNEGFSSTKGVHISMDSFKQVVYDPATGTAEVGAGNIWDDVYAALEPYGVNVVGGRVSGVGVAGFTLGGGYSWLTNQYGLTIDTVQAYELVKPDGTVSTVTAQSDADLFFALKGGLNNYGIVTKFFLKTFPQTAVWGGVTTFTFNSIPAVSAATAAFSANVTDPKASIITTYNFLTGQPGITLLMFYDWPTPPPGIFDAFLDIPHLTRDVKTRSFLSLVQASPVAITTNLRAHFQMVPVLEYTPEFIEAVVNQTIYWGSRLTLLGGAFFSYAVEPFVADIYSHSPSGPTAYPPNRSRFFTPFNIFLGWTNPLADETFRRATVESAEALVQAATRDSGSAVGEVSLYPNYASSEMGVERVWGESLARMRQVKSRVDPENVMGLTGGFKV